MSKFGIRHGVLLGFGNVKNSKVLLLVINYMYKVKAIALYALVICDVCDHMRLAGSFLTLLLCVILLTPKARAP